MTDRQPSTRELAETSDRGADDVEERARDDDARESTDDTNMRSQRTPADEPLTRDQSQKNEREGDSRSEARSGVSSRAQHEPLLPEDQTERFTTRWQEIQASFVDQPRDSVEQADALVADLMRRLAASFSTERERLEAQWDRGDDVSTEDLRVALTRYRSFFDRLLSA
jgi:hypothetical protein